MAAMSSANRNSAVLAWPTAMPASTLLWTVSGRQRTPQRDVQPTTIDGDPRAEQIWRVADGVQRLRLAELMAALSLATDLGMGQPLEQALRTCLIAIELAERNQTGPERLL